MEENAMRKEIRCFFQEVWNWIRKTLADKHGELPFGDGKKARKHCVECIERVIVINNTRIHVKSIFTGKTSLDKAMKIIVTRKISDSKLDH
jgi:hypothetical protein